MHNLCEKSVDGKGLSTTEKETTHQP